MIVGTCYYIPKNIKEETRMSKQERHSIVNKAITAWSYRIKKVSS